MTTARSTSPWAARRAASAAEAIGRWLRNLSLRRARSADPPSSGVSATLGGTLAMVGRRYGVPIELCVRRRLGWPDESTPLSGGDVRRIFDLAATAAMLEDELLQAANGRHAVNEPRPWYLGRSVVH